MSDTRLAWPSVEGAKLVCSLLTDCLVCGWKEASKMIPKRGRKEDGEQY
jgi:hypothetical protein